MSTTAPVTTAYAWVITLQKPTPRGMAVNTQYGVIQPDPGATRRGLFEQVRREIDQQFPELSGANVMFWSLEPNEL
jgi:hypothetical protein